jgi:hypothetical protein
MAEGLDMLRLGTIATGANMNLSVNLSFTKLNLEVEVQEFSPYLKESITLDHYKDLLIKVV